ncbi:hypothetical protein HDU96_001088 [Phlyctochytrium bullatum]|nr:hypothetical protein HDU96_001088 [Phlyctochytrium bullatum]
MASSPSTVIVAAGAAGTVLAIAAAYYFMQPAKKSDETPEGDFPYYKGHPIFGVTLDLFTANVAQMYANLRKTLGDAFYVWSLGSKTLMLFGGEHHKWALQKGDGKYVGAGWPSRWRDLIGAESLAFADKSNHRKFRTLLSKGISKTVISSFYTSLRRNCNSVLQGLAAQSKQGTVDVRPFHTTKQFTYSAVASFLAHADPAHEQILLDHRDDFFTWSEGLGDFVVPAWFGPRFSAYVRGMEARKRIEVSLTKIIKERRERMDKGETFVDSLGHLMDATDEEGNSLSPVQICDNFINLAFAGFDTTAGSICSIFHVLLHQISTEDLDMLRTEILSLEEPIEEETLNNLPVLDAFVKELLRLWAPVPGVLKKMEEDAVLPDGRLVKKDTPIMVHFLSNNYNEAFFPEPEAFRISRFLVDQVDKKHPNEFTPFSVGVRMCLGYQLAKLEMKMFTVELIRNFELMKGDKKSELSAFPIWCMVPYIRLKEKKASA